MQKGTNNYLDPAYPGCACSSFVLDDFGHHTLSCKHGGGELSRHNKLRAIFQTSANVLAWVHV